MRRLLLGGILLVALVALLAGTVWAQAGGPFIRPGCTSLTSPVAHSTACFDTTGGAAWKVYDGETWTQALPTHAGLRLKDYATGNGTTDDTIQLRKALASGGRVECGQGVYRFTGTLSVHVATRFVGLGPRPGANITAGNNQSRSCILEHDFSGDAIAITGVSGTVNAGVGSVLENVTIRQINGNGSGASGRCIVAYKASDTYAPSWVMIRDVNCEVASGANDWSVGITLDGADAATAPSAGGGLRDVWIENVRMNAGTNATAALHITAAANVSIHNSDFNGSNGHVIVTGPTTAKASAGVVITGGTINGTLAIDKADKVLLNGGLVATVTTSDNTSSSLIAPGYLTNTPAVPVGTNVVIAGLVNALGSYAFFTPVGALLEYRMNGIGFRNGTNAYIGTLDNQTFSIIANNSTVGVFYGSGSFRPGGFAFADIATVLTVNGQMAYCSDCTIANPCAGGGSGAIAKRLNGVNVCN